jgi:hypothetical protein
MASTLIQTVNPAVSTGTITATPTLTLSGSLILVFVGSSGLSEVVSTVTDNSGNVYAQAYASAGGTGGNTECWYAQNTTPTNSVVVTFSGSTFTRSVFVREYSGMGKVLVLDRTVTSNGSGTSVTTGASSATRNAAELVVCNTSCLGTSPTLSVGAGYGNYTSQAVIAAASLHAIEDKTVAALGTQTGTMTAGGTLPVWDVGLATFVIADTNILNNYQFVKVGDGMSVTEKTR